MVGSGRTGTGKGGLRTVERRQDEPDGTGQRQMRALTASTAQPPTPSHTANTSCLCSARGHLESPHLLRKTLRLWKGAGTAPEGSRGRGLRDHQGGDALQDRWLEPGREVGASGNSLELGVGVGGVGGGWPGSQGSGLRLPYLHSFHFVFT